MKKDWVAKLMNSSENNERITEWHNSQTSSQLFMFIPQKLLYVSILKIKFLISETVLIYLNLKHFNLVDHFGLSLVCIFPMFTF